MSNPKSFAKKKIPEQSRDSRFPWIILILAAAMGGFVFSCLQLNLVQDDAYISFRYAANFLSGHGLVFNYGERVEGYTNFLWVLLLAFFKGIFGVDYLSFSRFAGIVSGAALFPLLYLLLKQYEKKLQIALTCSLAIALLSNLSLAYWSVSGLETGAFSCVVLGALVLETRRSPITPAMLVVATLLRPEGALVFAVILIHRILVKRTFPWRGVLEYAVPLLPFAIFKLMYYGSLFPNSYYAKSGVGIDYIRSGLDYLWFFTHTAGVYGLVFLIPLLAVKKLWSKYSLFYIYTFVYVVYIVFIGGDVLKVYRFFVPIVPVLYFLFVVSLAEIIDSLKFDQQTVYKGVLAGTIVFSIASYELTREHVWLCRDAEITLVKNMDFAGTMLKKYMGDDFSVATPTLGMISYQLLGHRVIDMLGLTDATIARNPEKVEGIRGWTEHRFNSRYLLEQQPSFIIFSAEPVLMRHSEFRHNYSTIALGGSEGDYVLWRRNRPLQMSKDIVHPDVEFVNKISEASSFYDLAKPDEALADLYEARQRLGEDYAYISSLMADCYLRMNLIDSARTYSEKSIMLDSLCWESRCNLAEIARQRGDTAAIHRQTEILKRDAPWMFF
jgi:hypothetical protein